MPACGLRWKLRSKSKACKMVPHRYHNFGKVHWRADQPKMDRHLSNPHVSSNIDSEKESCNWKVLLHPVFQVYSCLPKAACTCFRCSLHLTGRWCGYTCRARNGANGLCSCSCGPLDGGRLFIQVCLTLICIEPRSKLPTRAGSTRLSEARMANGCTTDS